MGASRLHGRDRNRPSRAGSQLAALHGRDRNTSEKRPYPAYQVAPSRARGSKPGSGRRDPITIVAPHGRVDRNRTLSVRRRRLSWSRPSRARDRNRGPASGICELPFLSSPRLHGRGSKRSFDDGAARLMVAPSRARDETGSVGIVSRVVPGSRLHGRVDRKRHSRRRRRRELSRLHGCVIETIRYSAMVRRLVAPSRARGSKHKDPALLQTFVKVAPSRARGIETNSWTPESVVTASRAFTGAWIETRVPGSNVCPSAEMRLHGRVDRNPTFRRPRKRSGKSRLHGRAGSKRE